MKYIKNFEKININKPEIGDYVIAIDEDTHTDVKNFINNNIGKIVNIKNHKRFGVLYHTKYTNVDDDIEEWFTKENNLDKKCGIRCFYLHEIIAFSKNIEDLDTILNANKYNL